QQQIENREIIRDESISKLDFTDDAKEKIKEYNKLTYSLKGFFSEQAIGTLIGVFQLENDKGETHHYHSTLNYFKLPEEIRKYAEIIANLSLI
ncbi:MAG: hypothetical protein GX633_03850, partial [Clostridiales bacterium]|nr:hypothetical protein [Clostridiales bacterium]